MRRCRPLAPASLPCERQWIELVALSLAAALTALAMVPARAQDIVATGSMDPNPPLPPRPTWNDASWTGGQWGIDNPPSPPSSSSTYSTGPYEIYSGTFNSTFDGQSLRIPTGGTLWISGQQSSTSTVNLILDGGTLAGFETQSFQPVSTQFNLGGDVEVATDSTVSLATLQRGTTLTFTNGALTGGGVFRVDASDTGFQGGQPSAVILDPSTFTTSGFTGSFAVDAGVLRIEQTIFPAGAEIEIAPGARFELPLGSGQQPEIGAISGTGTFAFGSTFLTIGAGDASGTFNGTIAGTGGVASGQLKKVGTGTFVFNGDGSALSYGIVEAGTLALGTDASLPPALDIQSGATFAAGTNISEATIANALENNWRIFSGAYFGLDTSLGNRTFTLTINDPPDPANPGQTGTLNFSKNGANTLRMMGAQNYTGFTSIAEGAHVLGQTAALPGYNQPGAFSVEPGAALGVVTALSDQVVADLLATRNFQPNSAIAFDTTDGDRNYAVVVTDTLDGPLGVAKTGTGTLTLSATNVYTGTTYVWGGTLAVPTPASMPGYDTAGKFSVGAGATLCVGPAFTDAQVDDMLALDNFDPNGLFGFGTSSASRTYAGTISGVMGIANCGTGTLTLSGANSYTGDTTNTAGSLTITGSLGTGGVYPGNIVTNGPLVVDSPTSQTFAGVISGTGSLEKNGTNTLTLGGDNTYAGATTINAGTLELGNGGTTGSLGAGSMTLATGAALAFNRSDDLTVSNAISGGGTIIQNGTNTLTLSPSNTHTGGTVVNNGTLSVTAASSLGTGAVTLNAGTMKFTDVASLTNDVVLGGSATIKTEGNAPSLDVEYLIVAGGGGGAGRDIGGGGGGGGYRSSVVGEASGGNSAAEPMVSVAPGSTNAVEVGSGGGGGRDATAARSGGKGQDSSVFGIVAIGGSGGTGWGELPTSGGSGGGGNGQGPTGPATSGGAGTAGQGSNGGTGFASGADYGGAGGGGAGEVGADATAGRTGGDGLLSNITGTPTYYAGGGGGAGHRTSGNRSLGAGGLGGGGSASINGGATSTGVSGLGGGGGASRAVGATGGAGGSGVVIIRYAGAPAATGGTIDTTSVPGYTVHTFNVGSSSFDVISSLPMTTTMSGNMTGSGGFTFDSPGTLVLTGTNTYQGSTVVADGTVIVGNGGGTGSLGTGNVVNNGSLIVNRSGSLAIPGDISGTGALVKLGSGLLALDGTNSYVGNTTVSAGTLSIGLAASLPGFDTNGRYSVTAGAALAVGNGVTEADVTAILASGNLDDGASLGFDTSAGDRSFTAVIADAGSNSLGLVKVGDNTLTLSGSGNTYSGGTTVAAGTLSIASTGVLPGYNVAGDYTVASGATLAVRNGVTDQNVADMLATGNFAAGSALGFDTGSDSAPFFADRTVSSTIADTATGSLGLTKVGLGTLTLSGANTYTGGTTIGAGTLTITSAAALPGSNVDGDFTVSSGATLAVTDGVTGAELAGILGTSNFEAGSSIGFDTTAADRVFGSLSDPAAGALGVVKIGTGTLTLSGTNTYSGGTNVTAGTVAVTTAAALPGFGDDGAYTVADGATLTVRAGVVNSEVDAILATNNFQAGSNFGFDTTDGDRTYATAIADGAGSLGIVKSGTGTLTLSGSNTYSGGTTISAGTLHATTAASLPGFGDDGAYSVANGATLTVGNAVTDTDVAAMLGTTNFQAGAKFGFDTTSGDRTYSGTIANTASGALGLVKTGPGTLTLSGTNTYTGGTTVTEGAIAIASAASLPGYNTNGAYSVAAGGTMAVGNSVTDSEISAMLGTTNFQAGAVLGFDTASGDRSYTAAIADTAQGSLGLTKTGTDALTLSGTSTYTGPTTVEDGELFINGSLANTSSVSVIGGLLGGTGSITNGLSVGGAGTLSPGDAATPIGAFSAGATSLASGATLGFEVDSTAPINPATAADLMVVNGNLNIASGSILDFTDIASSVNPFPDQTTFALINYTGSWDGGLFSFGGSTLTDGAIFTVGGQHWQIDYDSPTGGANFTGDYVAPGSFVTVTAVPVPEPATLGLLAAAAGCGALLRRRTARRS